jgi:hypothetical protein
MAVTTLAIIAAISSLERGSPIVYGETRRISSILSNSRESSLRSVVLRSPVVFYAVFAAGGEVYPVPS